MGRLQAIRLYWSKFSHNKAAAFGAVTLAIIIGLGTFGPLLSPFDPSDIGGKPLAKPSLTHLMGTDRLGRDVLSGVLHGIRTSLYVGFVAALTAAGLGGLFGTLSGYYRGWIDDLLMRTLEFFQVLPRFFLGILLAALFGSKIEFVILVIAVLSWMPAARLVRAEILTLKEREFILAAKGLGYSDARIIVSELLPNVLQFLVINTSLQIGRAMLFEASLSFLGLGDPNVPTLGQLLEKAQLTLRLAWWPALFPGSFITLLVLSANLVGDGINDALNPRAKGWDLK
ncbi:MAG: ABC transporter permease [Deltaproteobacteria bacterium]